MNPWPEPMTKAELIQLAERKYAEAERAMRELTERYPPAEGTAYILMASGKIAECVIDIPEGDSE